MLEVEGLTKYFPYGTIRKQYVRAVDGVSFKIKKGETLDSLGRVGAEKRRLTDRFCD